LNLDPGYFAPRSTQPFNHPGSVNKYVYSHKMQTQHINGKQQ